MDRVLLILRTLILFFFTLGIAVLVLGLVKTESDSDDYGIIFDAGSSHTELHLFSWPHRDDRTTPLVEEAEIKQLPGPGYKPPGINSFVSDPSAAGRSLLPLFEEARLSIPKEKHKYTPVYLKATAGMRELNNSNPEACFEILNSVRSTIRDSGFEFQEESWASIMSGEDEGMFGWITVNYLSGYLQGKTPSSFGALDMGGASTQISFIPRTPPAHDSNEVCLFGFCSDIYTHSFLGFGLDSFRKQQQTRITPPSGTSNDPCLAEGFAVPNASTPSLIGSGDFSACANLAVELLPKTPCDFDNCSFDNVYQPTLQGKFVAFSGFFYTMDFLVKHGLISSYSPDIKTLREVGTSYCRINATELGLRFPDVKPKYLAQYCMNIAYMASLLTHGYGFPEENSGIEFRGEEQSVSLGWTLGAMVDLANLLPLNQIKTPILPTKWAVVLGAVAVAVLVLAGVLIMRRNQHLGEENRKLLLPNTPSPADSDV